MPATWSGSCWPMLALMLVPQSLPWAPYRAYPSRAINAAQAPAIRPTPQPGRAGLSLNSVAGK